MTSEDLKNNLPEEPNATKTIKRLAEKMFQWIQPGDDVRKKFYMSFPLLIASVAVGIVAVIYAKLFLIIERFGIEMFSRYPYAFLAITPLCFLVSWFFVYRFAPFARGSGIPQVMAALELSETADKSKISRLVSLRIVVVKIVSSLVLVLGGGAIGREGPTIHIAGSIFRSIGKYIPKQWPQPSERIMILTGSAAGLAAAFNTPLGGIVFAIEELGKAHFSTFRTSLLTAVIVAGMMAQMILGPYLYLGYPKASGLDFPIMGIALFAAAIIGLVGASFSKMVLWIFKWKSTFKGILSQIGFIILLSLLLWGTAVFITPDALGSGKDIMVSLLFGKETTPSLYLVSSRLISPLLSFTSGGAAGIFAPALASGATIGASISSYFVMTPEQANVIILAGMVAFLTAVTRSPFTSSILVLEMTDRHALIFILMLTGLVSYLTAWIIDKKSLYEHLMEGYIEELEKQATYSDVSSHGVGSKF